MMLCNFMIIHALTTASTYAIYQEWKQNTNMGSTSNWVGEKLPCETDRVLIDQNIPVVYMQTDLTIRELILPKDGNLLFGREYSLKFNDDNTQRSVNCKRPPKDVIFKPPGTSDWFNTQNWCGRTSKSPGESCLQALLDTEKVPCNWDDVIFPEVNAYFVKLGYGANIPINSLTLSKTLYDQSSWRQFLASPTGKSTFLADPKNPSNISIYPRKCTDATGCVCRENNDVLEKTICNIMKPHCSPVPCTKSIQPRGMCCPMCGAQLLLWYNKDFSLIHFKNHLSNLIAKKGHKESTHDFIVSKVQNRIVQIVIRDRGNNFNAPLIGQIIADLVLTDIAAGSKSFGIRKLTFNTSSYDSQHRRVRLNAGETAGLVIGVLVLVCLITFLTVGLIKYSGRLRNISLQRLRRPLRVPEFFSRFTQRGPVTGVAFAYNSQRNITTDICGFDNPMFDTEPSTMDTPTFSRKEPDSYSSAREGIAMKTIPRDPARTGNPNPMFAESD